MGHELFRLLTNLGEKLNKEEAKNLMRSSVSLRMKMVSCPSSPSSSVCAATNKCVSGTPHGASCEEMRIRSRQKHSWPRSISMFLETYPRFLEFFGIEISISE